MAHLIDKDALVAEIESLRKYYIEKGDYDNGWNFALDKILSLIDTLEVKEVDLDKDYKEFVEEDPVYSKLVNGIVGKAIAKHFFELGLLSTITEEDCKLIWNISDELPCMREEDFFKELLRRYKAQKGEQL